MSTTESKEERRPEGEVPDWSHGKPLMAGEWFLGLYQPSPETREYWSGIGRRELLLKWCEGCRRAYHPRRIVCTACGSADLTWRRASGRGVVFTYSEVHRAPQPEFAAAVPYTVGLVELEEGVHIFTRLFSRAGETVEVGTPVELDFRVLELGQFLPVFVTGASDSTGEEGRP